MKFFLPIFDMEESLINFALRFTLTIALLTLIHSSFGEQQKDCDLRKSAEGIEVYTCKVDDSKIKSIQSSFALSNTFADLADALIDLDNFHKWQYKIRKTEMLKHISKDEFVYRAELETPWPVSNRDLILHVKLSKGPSANEYHFSAIGRPDFIPPRPGFVRVPLSEAHWYIKVTDQKNLEIKHTILIDPGGNIPSWLMNLSLAEGPYQTFKNLRVYLRSSKQK